MHYRCYWLTMDDRISGMPAEFSAPDEDAALAMAARLYRHVSAERRHGIELWDGPRRVFAGDPLAATPPVATTSSCPDVAG